MFIENRSKLNFEETVEQISTLIAENGWKVITVHDLQETMKKNGKDVRSVKVIETCNPNHAYKILSQDDERIASNTMPCRISVYEKSDGKTYFSRMNAEAMAGQAGGIIQEVMTDAFRDMENILKEVSE
ncbi:MAG: DUF302 domain-containing protein [Candidatus Kapabacteria bacterium]|nr:DUF302 domain-containing protein [Ignavibacteriota bacterium]MCW5884520.1 DUF302 domain-containing protein [Candidatus Kapabacteria bacterium]